MRKNMSDDTLFTIENDKRPRVVKKRNGSMRFKIKKHHRRNQVIAMTSVAAILSVGVVTVGSIFTTAAPNVVDPGFVTVSYELPLDGSKPVDHSALENIGYLNRRFQMQTNWYSEMHGSTVANTMGLNVAQSVNTYKQFDNGTLIMADITTSSMVNKARQFCYQGDEVLWRMGSGSPSSWPTGKMGDDLFSELASMSWQTGDPYGHMSLASFTEKNGLPGTGFCVYVINEETLLRADDVIDHGDGTYSQTYYLDPAVDKAPCHYVNQMVFTGDLPSLPEFNYITVTYTFDADWQILKSYIDEQYTAVMGVSATCSSAYETNFEYNTPKAISNELENYFSDYIGEPFVEPSAEKEITSLNCLTSAFASVLTEPVTFDLSLNFNGKVVSGKVFVDLSKGLALDTMDVRAQIGSLNLWISDGSAYVEYGGVRIKTSVSELIDFIGEIAGSDSGAGISLDTDALLSGLAGGEFSVGESSATLSSTLSLGFDIPVSFHFNIDADKNVTLGDVMAQITVENIKISSLSLGSLEIGAILKFSDDEVPALTNGEKETFTDVIPLAKDILALMKSEVLGVNVNYAGEGFAVSGNLDIKVNDIAKLDIALQGTITATVGNAQKSVFLAYQNETLYVELDGIKVKVNVKDGIALISNYLPKTQSEGTSLELNEILTQILSKDFAELLQLNETESNIEIVIKGTELLKAFGLDFALGDITLGYANGTLCASVLGANVAISESKNEITAINDGEYIAVLDYLEPIESLVKAEALQATLNYEKDNFAVNGNITLNLKELAAYGSATVSYNGFSKTLNFIYEYSENGGTVYLGVDGLKVKAEVSAILGVVSDLLGKELSMPEMPKLEAMTIVEKVLSFDFATLLNISEDENGINAVIYGTELLKAFGVDFALGNVELTIDKDGVITANALGIDLTVAKGTYTKPTTEGYTDISVLIESVPEIIALMKSEVLGVNVNYAGEGFAVSGNLDIKVNDIAKLDIALQGTITATVGNAQKSVFLAYQNETLYVELDGIKVKVNVKDGIALISNYLPKTQSEGTSLELNEILTQILSKDFAELLQLNETESNIEIVIKGTELLKAFGVDFALGDITLGFANGTLSASVLGANVAISESKNEIKTINDGEYIAVLDYVEPIESLVKAEALQATLNYEKDNFAVNGNITLNLKELAAYGSATVSYNGFSKTLNFIYEYSENGGTVYLGVDGLKVKAEVSAILGVVSDLLGKELSMPEMPNLEVMTIVEKVLSFDFATLLNISEDENGINAVIYGTELLKAFGVDFALGNVELTIDKDGVITANALGIDLTVAKGTYTKPTTEGYFDVSPIVAVIPDILKAEKIGFNGNVTLTVGKTEISLDIVNGVLSWANGLNVTLQANVRIGSVSLPVFAEITTKEIALTIDGFATRLSFDSFKDIKTAVESLYHKVATTINQIVVTGEEEGLLVDNLEGLMQKLGVSMTAFDTLGGFDLGILNDFVIGAPVSENGICTLTFKGLSVELLGGTENEYLGATLSYSDKSFDVSGGVSVMPAGRVSLPDGTYWGLEDYLEFFDYIDAALNTLTAKNVSLSFDAGVASGNVDYYAGGDYVFTVNTAEKNITVNTDLYLHADVTIGAKDADKKTYIELYVLDYDNDEKLDFFVTLSSFEKADAKYQPLKLYATAEELTNLVAIVCATTGIDDGIVYDYLVSKFLSIDTVASLHALGNSLFKSLGINGLFAVTAAEEGESSGAGNFIKLLSIDKQSLVLETEMFNVTLDKVSSEDGNGAMVSYLTGIGVAVKDTNVSVAIDATNAVSKDAVTLDDSYFKLEGIARLLKILATSATHAENGEIISGEEQPAKYVLNDFFYIDGTIIANLNVMGIISKEVKVKLVAVSVSVDAESGAVSANVRLEYDGVNVAGITAINGDTVLDLTLKENMVYMKRVQSTYFDGTSEKRYPNPVTVYRVMPLANLGKDIVNQAAFLLNLGSVITDNLPSGDDGSTGDTTPAEPQDFGALFSSLIGSCVYTPNQDGTASYVLTIKGSALTDIMDDIVIDMQSRILPDGKEVLYNLGVKTGIKYSVIDVDLDAALVYENPCALPVEDKTFDIAALVSNAMAKALDEAQKTEWNGNLYIEGQTTTVSYVLAGETIAVQEVLFNGKTGECYANLALPDTSAHEHKGYDIKWDLSEILRGHDEKYYISANQMIYGSYQAKVYTLTLTGANDWAVEFDYVYGTDLVEEINKAYATQNSYAVSCSLTLEDILNGNTQGEVVWESHDYTVTYYDQSGNEFAAQYYKANEALCYPQTAPTRVGYLLDGWQNAAGERVEVGNAVAGDMQLYPVWIVDASADVTVYLYSDLRYQLNAQSTFDPALDGFYIEQTYTAQSGYALPQLSAEGYQQMGWWYFGENGQWSCVSEVTGLNGATLWAVWIQNIEVTVTNFAEKNATFTIEGTVVGGTVYGKKSKEIFTATQMSESTTGVYTIYRKNGENSDNLKYGKEIEIVYGDDGVGTFSSSGMTSFNGLWWTVGYGGIKITKTFSYGSGLTVSTQSASYVSKDSYTVTFVDADGKPIKAVSGVRADYPYDSYDNNVFVDELAAKEGISVPGVVGYKGSWQHVPVTGNVTVSPSYEKRTYAVTLQSADGKQSYTFDMLFGETITAWTNDDVCTVYTVEDDSVNSNANVFTLPALDVLYKWEISDDMLSTASFQIYTGLADLTSDYIRYNSALAISYDGENTDKVLEEVTEGYALLNPTLSGYTFLGWYRKENNAWKKFDLNAAKDDGVFRTYDVEALWMSDWKVTMSAEREFHVGTVKNYYHTVSVAVEGGELFGVPAKDATLTMTYEFSANNSANDFGNANASQQYNVYTPSYSKQFEIGSWGESGKKSHAHARVSLVYNLSGETFALSDMLTRAY